MPDRTEDMRSMPIASMDRILFRHGTFPPLCAPAACIFLNLRRYRTTCTDVLSRAVGVRRTQKYSPAGSGATSIGIR